MMTPEPSYRTLEWRQRWIQAIRERDNARRQLKVIQYRLEIKERCYTIELERLAAEVNYWRSCYSQLLNQFRPEEDPPHGP